MFRKLVTVQKILAIQDIPGTTNIEVATIKGWKVVIEKNKYKTGDFVLFFEVDSFLPVKHEYEFLLKGSKPKKMLVEGKEVEGIRLRTVKLKGQISQGLLMPITEEFLDSEEGENVTEKLGIIKYEQPVAPYLSGIAKGNFPGFIPKTDEERIQNMPEVFSTFYMTEKLDGASVTYYKKDGVFGVCSRNLELKEGDTTQWRIAKELDLPNKIYDNFALQGEVVGSGIQKNPYKLNTQKVYFFNAYNIKSGHYLNYEEFINVCKIMGIETVPIINENYSLPQDMDFLIETANGKSLLNSEVEREGIVIRKKVGERLSFKAISNKYLLDYEE